MYPTLVHIYGPFSIHSYGFMIVLGLCIYSWLTLKNPLRKKLVTTDQFFTITSWSIISGLIGGHLLYVLTEHPTLEELIRPAGLSILGSIIGVIIFLAAYLRMQSIPTLPFLDLAAINAPIIQGFGRIGCFLAGCCYGSPTSLPWAMIYTHPDIEAPLCIALHPSQLYSAALLFCIALVLRSRLQYRFTKPGQLFGLYLMLVSAERFFTDFFRYDHTTFISPYQSIALSLMCLSLLWLWFASLRRAR